MKTLSQSLAQVEAGIDPFVRKKTLQVIKSVCKHCTTFTTDLIHQELDYQIEKYKYEPRMLGALLVIAHRKGWCKTTGRFKKSNRPINHSRPISIWKSLLNPSVRLPLNSPSKENR